jgi:hypothetical protein
MYTPLSGVYDFAGEVRARVTKPEGYCAWFGPIDEAIQVAAPDRSELLDSLQYKVSASAATTVKAIVLQKKNDIAEAVTDSTKLAINQSGARQQDSAVDSTRQQGR